MSLRSLALFFPDPGGRISCISMYSKILYKPHFAWASGLRDWLQKMSMSIEKTCKCQTYVDVLGSSKCRPGMVDICIHPYTHSCPLSPKYLPSRNSATPMGAWSKQRFTWNSTAQPHDPIHRTPLPAVQSRSSVNPRQTDPASANKPTQWHIPSHCQQLCFSPRRTCDPRKSPTRRHDRPRLIKQQMGQIPPEDKTTWALASNLPKAWKMWMKTITKWREATLPHCVQFALTVRQTLQEDMDNRWCKKILLE